MNGSELNVKRRTVLGATGGVILSRPPRPRGPPDCPPGRPDRCDEEDEDDEEDDSEEESGDDEEEEDTVEEGTFMEFPHSF